MKDKFKSFVTPTNSVGANLEYWYDKIQTDGWPVVEYTITPLNDGQILVVVHYMGDIDE